MFIVLITLLFFVFFKLSVQWIIKDSFFPVWGAVTDGMKSLTGVFYCKSWTFCALVSKNSQLWWGFPSAQCLIWSFISVLFYGNVLRRHFKAKSKPTNSFVQLFSWLGVTIPGHHGPHIWRGEGFMSDALTFEPFVTALLQCGSIALWVSASCTRTLQHEEVTKLRFCKSVLQGSEKKTLMEVYHDRSTAPHLVETKLLMSAAQTRCDANCGLVKVWLNLGHPIILVMKLGHPIG